MTLRSYRYLVKHTINQMESATATFTIDDYVNTFQSFGPRPSMPSS